MSTIHQTTDPGRKTVDKTSAQRFRFELLELGRGLPISKRLKQSRFPLGLLLPVLFGIVLPVATLAVELKTRMCAGTFLDPIPTTWHTILAGFVPAANLALVGAVALGKTRWPSKLAFANACAVGISGFYALLFAPLFPLAVIAVLFYGIGFLALAPLLSLISALFLRRSLRRLASKDRPAWSPRIWPGLAFGVAVLLLADVPATVTHFGLRRAASSNPEERDAGVRFLRVFGNQDAMARACYRRPGRALDLPGFFFSFFDPVSTAKAQEIYYRVTGKSFDSEPRPAFAGRGIFDLDPGQGGTSVGTTLDSLSLSASRLDGSVDATASLAYLEWTMEFQNARPAPREARAEIKLPAGGVVSRVTLWINGAEREAAFGPRGRVREAYERVVQARRDPLLVTTAGTDRILIQCFPVPPEGEMKIRIGMTQPLKPLDEQTSVLSLPHFVENNFETAKVEHLVWIEADSELRASSEFLKPEGPPQGDFALRGRLKDSALRDPAENIRLRHAPVDGSAWAADTLQPETHLIRQRIERRSRPPVNQVVAVIDGSAGMNSLLPEIAATLSSLPARIRTEILVAGDEVVRLANGPASLAKYQGEGGADSVPAIAQALDLAGGEPRAVILWIHASQPVLMEPVNGLRQHWNRRPGDPLLFAIQALPGRNRVLRSLEGVPEVRTVTRSGGLREDLSQLLSAWSELGDELVFLRERVERADLPPGDSGRQTSGHLARLWANDEVSRLTQSRNEDDRDQAVSLATAYRIVTSVSGAVVLETQAQYEQAGLEPADPSSVPTIPEPEVWMLMLVLSGLMGWKLLAGRRRWTGA